jgi:hypothetical protein
MLEQCLDTFYKELNEKLEDNQRMLNEGDEKFNNEFDAELEAHNEQLRKELAEMGKELGIDLSHII